MRRSTFFCFVFLWLAASVYADESDIIKADRQALGDAESTGISSKIIAAKEQLSDDLGMQQEQRRKDEQGVVIPLVADEQGHLVADVVIDHGVHASLVVDTGSPVVMLTSKFVQKLGLDLSQANEGFVEVLNGKYKAAAVTLDTLKLGSIEAHNVDATVLLEETQDIKDGLLGLSFLNKYHITLDQSGQKLIIRK